MTADTPRDVLFIYRNNYIGPLGLRVVRLRGRSVLEWLQIAWREAQAVPENQFENWLEQEFGGSVYGIWSIFDHARESGAAPPATHAELDAMLDAHLYVESEYKFDGRCLRALTDDDEIDLAYFICDAAFPAEHPERFAFLLRGTEWALPTEIRIPPSPNDSMFQPPDVNFFHEFHAVADGVGDVYAVVIRVESKYPLDDLLGADRIRGLRLPEFLEFLRTVPPADENEDAGDESFRSVFKYCDTLYLRDALPDDFCDWRTALNAMNRKNLGQKNLSQHAERALFNVSPHFAQMCAYNGVDWEQWFFFDDVWAANHPHLAASLLHFAAQWDPLHE